MHSISTKTWAGLFVLYVLASAGMGFAADWRWASDPVAFYTGRQAARDSDPFDVAGWQMSASPSGAFPLEKTAMKPSGNPLLADAPRAFRWTRKGGGVTRYRLKLSLRHPKTGQYLLVCKSWIPQPVSGNPKWKPPVHAIITGGQYRWTITDYVGARPILTSVAFFRIQTEKRAYMVIDLSGGTSAATFPVIYLNAIPAGTFTMGSPTGQLGHVMEEEQQRSVTLTKDFYIGVFEVTQRQWELVMGNRPSYFNDPMYYRTRPVERVSYYDIREDPKNAAISPNWPQSSQAHRESFMGVLRAKTGMNTLDLPTEAQWEYACRAGTATALNSRRNLMDTQLCPNVAQVGRYRHNGDPFTHGGVPPSAGTDLVGAYHPNAWGLYDMHGNVMEWCLDWWSSYSGAVTNPPGAESGSVRMLRGGSWSSTAQSCRSASRDCEWPSDRQHTFGFRVARTLP